MAVIWVLICAVSTWFMTGLIWFVQIVQYPSFVKVGTFGSREFHEFHDAHVRRTTSVVMGPMVLEMVSSVMLAIWLPEGVPRWLALGGLGMAVACFISTAAVQMPLHARLGRDFDRAAAERLVSSNWLRTAAWTAHSVIVLTMLTLMVR